MDFAIIGGDKRQLYLRTLLEEDGHHVTLHQGSLRKTLANHQHLICGVPFAKEGHLFTTYGEKIPVDHFLAMLTPEHVLIGGNLQNIPHPHKIDLLTHEPFVQYNAIPTAEGVLQIAMEETDATLNGAQVMVIGFGRIGALCAKLFTSMGAVVTVVTRSATSRSQSISYGLHTVPYTQMCTHLPLMDLIINTPPGEIVTAKHILYIKETALVIDISSPPFGVSKETEKYGIKTIWARALPGIVAPYSGAVYMKQAIYELLSIESGGA